jgi:hypothetical protein
MRKALPREAAFMESTIQQGVQNVSQNLGNGFRIVTSQLKRSPGHHGLMKAFYQSLRTGSSAPITGEDGMHTVQILDMLDRAVSAKKNAYRSQNYRLLAAQIKLVVSCAVLPTTSGTLYIHQLQSLSY